MNATELFQKDGKSSGVWYCEKCRIAKRTEQEAESCCKPHLCEDCGKETDGQYITVCNGCRSVRDIAREAERFQKSTKLTEWGGPVYMEGLGFNDGFASCLSDLVEMLDQGDHLPEYVWTCHTKHFVNFDLDDITERFCDGAYADWDPKELNGRAEFEAAIQVFIEANKDSVSWEPNFKVALLVKQEGGAK